MVQLKKKIKYTTFIEQRTKKFSAEADKVFDKV